ncbi:GtrA family protein [Stenotrophomonas sp. OVS01A]|uniref:GtrA family protein n=1 Tax=Stenotrophomonas sp. OVS01A TaxID=2862680 RepID=UPI001CBEF624|nr:GtrA family protein [Stenotrophomonas sp. OVS01A]
MPAGPGGRSLIIRIADKPVVRQLVLYGVVGGAQLLLDYAVFVGLTAAGLAVISANLIGRVSGACVGYFLNRHITFAGIGQDRRQASHERGRMIRFAIAWVGLTFLGTAALELLAANVDLKATWVAKPVIDGLLAVFGFVLSRHWIYR